MIVSYPKKGKAMIVYCDFINAEAELFCVNTLWRVEYVIILIHSTFPPNKVVCNFFLIEKQKHIIRIAMIVYCDFINAEAKLFCVNTLWRVEYIIILIHSTFPTNKGTRLFLLARNF